MTLCLLHPPLGWGGPPRILGFEGRLGQSLGFEGENTILGAEGAQILRIWGENTILGAEGAQILREIGQKSFKS